MGAFLRFEEFGQCSEKLFLEKKAQKLDFT